MAAASGPVSGGAKRKRQNKFACGTPAEYCCGSIGQVAGSLSKNPRTHGSPEQSFNCYRNYLLKTGYVQIGPREFTKGPNDPVVFLTKKSKFGARLRGGKGERFMPEKMMGGHIIG